MEKTAPSSIDTVAPPRNFTLSIEERLRAYAQGLPGYIRRWRRIEDLEARLVARLRAAVAPLEVVASAEVAAELALLNDLIDRHNRYYPIEATARGGRADGPAPGARRALAAPRRGDRGRLG